MADTKKLVKTNLAPATYAQLVAYAARNHRTVSNAAEFLIAAGLFDSLSTEHPHPGGCPCDEDVTFPGDIHTREDAPQ